MGSKHQKKASQNAHPLKKISPASFFSRDNAPASNLSASDASSHSLPSADIAQEMIGIWNQAVEGDSGKITLTWWRAKKLKQSLRDSFNSDLCEWKAYCSRIAANTFLMGGGARGWKASLDWSLRPENIQKVREGVYTGQKEPTSVTKEREKPLSPDELQGSPLWQSLCLALSHSIGSPAFRSWFQDVIPVDLEGEFPQLRCASVFRAQWIKSHFGQSVDMVFRKALPKVRGVEIVC